MFFSRIDLAESILGLLRIYTEKGKLFSSCKRAFIGSRSDGGFSFLYIIRALVLRFAGLHSNTGEFSIK